MPYDDSFIRSAARQECRKIADEIVGLIKSPGFTPRDSGALQDGYHAADTTDGAEVRSSVDYWAAVEYGHHIPAGSTPRKTASNNPPGFVPAQPHVRRAIEDIKRRRAR